MSPIQLSSLICAFQELDPGKLLSVSDITYLLPFVEEHSDFLSPTNHYRLLCYISNMLAGQTLIDVGTNRGSSAVCLGSNPMTNVITYDIINKVNKVLPKNVEQRILNLIDFSPHDTDYWNNPAFQELRSNWKTIFSAPFIMADLDPHDGKKESFIHQWLVANKYRGVVLYDDVSLNPEMKAFWNSITNDKIDYTHLGHHSGTGVVFYKPDGELVQLPNFKRISV
jgi:hypothetical protein